MIFASFENWIFQLSNDAKIWTFIKSRIFHPNLRCLRKDMNVLFQRAILNFQFCIFETYKNIQIREKYPKSLSRTFYGTIPGSPQIVNCEPCISNATIIRILLWLGIIYIRGYLFYWLERICDDLDIFVICSDS